MDGSSPPSASAHVGTTRSEEQHETRSIHGGTTDGFAKGSPVTREDPVLGSLTASPYSDMVRANG